MKVMRGIGSDSRIGPKFLFPGVGFGGSCFPKDVRALIKTSKDFDYDFTILQQVMDVNEMQKVLFLKKIGDFYGNKLTGKRFAIWGLAFKPNTDDMREAPSVYIARGLASAGATCYAYDPRAMETAAHLFADIPSVIFGKNQYEILDGVDGLILVTEWLSFREPDFERMKSLMKGPVIFDGRNQYNPKTLARLGFQYFCIGRPPTESSHG
jgi:UDPglucose 6-dehydrogenase